MENAILIIDMQNDFVLPGAPLEVAGAMATIPAIAAFVKHGRERGCHIIHVMRRHAASGADAEMSRRHLFASGKPYCVPGTAGAEPVRGLEPLEGDHVVYKTRFSAFFGTNLDTLLRSLKAGRLFQVN